MMEYKKLSSKGGLNIPVKLRRMMGIEPKDPVELRLTVENELVVKAYQTRCIFCGTDEIIIKKNGKGICEGCLNDICNRKGEVL